MSVNLAVVRGHLTSPPEVRTLPSGRELAVLQITTRPASGAISVPVAVWDPPAWLVALDAGAELVAVGTVRRRFFRAGSRHRVAGRARGRARRPGRRPPPGRRRDAPHPDRARGARRRVVSSARRRRRLARRGRGP